MPKSGFGQTEIETGIKFIVAWEDRAMKRQRIKHKTTFEERLAEEARRFEAAAEEQPPGSTARELATIIECCLGDYDMHPPFVIRTVGDNGGVLMASINE